MLKIVNYADVLSENYTYPITVGKNIFSHHKLLVMLLVIKETDLTIHFPVVTYPHLWTKISSHKNFSLFK